MERESSPEKVHPEPSAVADLTYRSESAPPLHMEASTANTLPQQNIFHFSSPQAYPVNTDDAAGPDPSSVTRRNFATPRRPSNRPSSRNVQRSLAQNLFSLGNGSGQKRKLMQDFFNIDTFNDRRDGPGGGGPKRGRMS